MSSTNTDTDNDASPKPPSRLDEKARRGWWFSVLFLLCVLLLILFLAYVKVQEENRDVLIGILGVITGSISSMLAVASGRDPAEVDALKAKLADANADRAALIARLRDAQIQLQLKSEQLGQLQLAIIDRLSLLSREDGGHVVTSTSDEQVVLNKTVEEWLPKS